MTTFTLNLFNNQYEKKMEHVKINSNIYQKNNPGRTNDCDTPFRNPYNHWRKTSTCGENCLTNTKVLKEEVVTIAKSRKELPKVPFGELVEQGIIPPGAVLTDKKERFKATVSIDGTLKIKDLTGSIHQMGAKIQGLPSCNGWDFWHVKDKSKSILLDEIRSNYRKDKLN